MKSAFKSPLRLVLPALAVFLFAGAAITFGQAMCGKSCEDSDSTAAPVQTAATPATAPATQAAAPANTKCPVSGDDIDPKITILYNGKVIAFCCQDCIKEFNKDPKKFTAAMK